MTMDALRELQNSKQSFMRVSRQRDTQRRSRTILSCTPCRQRKIKCDRLAPCSQCIRRSAAESCDYLSISNQADIQTSTSPSAVQNSATSPNDVGCTRTYPVAPVEIPQHTTTLRGPTASLTASCNDNSPVTSTQMGSVDTLTQSCFHGSGTRTRFFGRSHWALTMDMFPDLKAHLQKHHKVKKGPTGPDSNDAQGVNRTKQRRLQRTYQTHGQTNPETQRLESMIPARQITDELVHLYLSTFETTLRILHVPQFLAEYEEFWNSTDQPSLNDWSQDVFAAKLLTVLICVTPLVDTEILRDEDRSQVSNRAAKGWLQAVGSWVKTITSYAKLDLDFIQVMCLLLIARQAIAYEGDLAWLAAGSLVREAMMIGLHRDPSNFKGISPFFAEIRRRLWFTIIELDLQAALDTGVTATISEDDFDCVPPSNLNDEELCIDSSTPPTAKLATVLTRTSFQISLAQTLSVRIKVVKIINQIRLTSTYQDILDLSQVITADLSQSTFLSALDRDKDAPYSEFRKSIYLFLVYRYLLALHRPFVLSLAETRTEMYTYSRRICTEACLSLLSPLKVTANASTEQVLYPHILRLRGGMFRSELFHAAATLCFELRLQVADKILPLLPGSSTSDTDWSTSRRGNLIRTVESAIEYFAFKVRTEKQACKAFMLLNMVYASAQSELFSGTDTHAACETDTSHLTLENACPRAARRCQQLLLEGEGRAECQHSEENWLGYPGNPFMDISFDWGMYLDPAYLNETGNLWPLMDPLI
ncbi:fungal-specific transcription factor domain-containing protein [Penicillium malachiteum]|uniref:Fungal-specific transcription factor domain-containing protein n=1 Tax=Penicillium malachiteum TaxID=1324776 RepID=A0AAD6MQH3_9EURO|nr:fungal-specific transcription factor domain-containing protein [Penicillium malachiteum]